MMKIVADQAKCVGSGNCVMSLPGVFTQDEDDGLVRVLHSAIRDGELETVRAAVLACPAQALRISAEED